MTGEQQSESRAESFARLGIFFAGIAAFFNSLANQFALDDLIHIVQNPYIQNLSNLPSLFLQPMYPGNLYRPLVSASYAVTYAVSGLDPAPYHLTNVVLHSLVGVLIYEVLKQAISRRSACMIALLFAVHPIHVEAVANVSGRSELLCSFFGLTALLLHLRGKNIALAAGALLASLLSKETGFCFVLLMLLCSAYLKRSVRGSTWGAWLGAGLTYLGLRLFALAGAGAGLETISFIDNPLIALPWYDRVLHAMALLGKYAALVLVPGILSADYSYAHLIPRLSGVDLPSVIVFCALLAVALLGFMERHRASFFALWFLLSFAITSNIAFPIGTIFGERLAYLPSIGMIGICVHIIEAASSQLLRLGLAGIYGALFMFVTVGLNPSWRDNTSLYSRQIYISPRSAKTQLNYGISLRNKRRFGEARQHLKEALRIYPGYGDAAFGRATTYLHQGDLEHGKKWLERTLKINPAHTEALNLLGRMAFNAGNFPEARAYLERALEVDPENFETKIGMLALYANDGADESARSLYLELRRIAPEHQELKRLGKKLMTRN